MNLPHFFFRVLLEPLNLQHRFRLINHRGRAAEEDVGVRGGWGEAPGLRHGAVLPQVLHVAGRTDPRRGFVVRAADDRQVSEIGRGLQRNQLRPVAQIPRVPGTVEHGDFPRAAAHQMRAEHAHVRRQARAGGDHDDVGVGRDLVERKHAGDLRPQPDTVADFQVKQAGCRARRW